MIEMIFTLDYEIYGSGTGSIIDLIYEPTEQLASLFRKWGSKFVLFAEVLELQKMEQCPKYDGINDVLAQVRELYDEGFEIGLHIHPQWCNALREANHWVLDMTEYNACTMPAARVKTIIAHAIEFMRKTLASPRFVPVSFRGGNWLLQPTATISSVLVEHGIRIDSSVFKGGCQKYFGLDYRHSLKNGYYWQFSDDVNEPDPAGQLFEVPIYSEMISSIAMLSAKRVGVQARNFTGGKTKTSFKKHLNRLFDFARFSYPCKLDFCRLSATEMKSMMDKIIQMDRQNPESYKPIVAIGHSKDLTDIASIEIFLSYLERMGIATTDFRNVFDKLQIGGIDTAPLRTSIIRQCGGV
jgi:hypothetical protein